MAIAVAVPRPSANIDALTQQMDHARQRIAALIGQYAEAFQSQGRLRLAEVTSQAALAIHGQALSPTLPVLLGTLGNLYLKRREPENAFEMFSRGMEASQCEADRDLEAQLLNGRGAAESALGNQQDAIKHLTMAAEIAREGGVKNAVRGDVLTNLALALAEQGSSAEAQQLLSQAVALRRQAQDLVGLVNALANMGLLHMRAREFENARTIYSEAVGLAVKNQLNDHISVSPLLGLATAEAALGDIQPAVEHANNAVRLARRSFGRTSPGTREAEQRLELISQSAAAQ